MHTFDRTDETMKEFHHMRGDFAVQRIALVPFHTDQEVCNLILPVEPVIAFGNVAV